MSNYTKSTNFTAKDTLPSGNSGKIVKGTEIDTELTAVAAAISSKADVNSPTFTGTPAAPTASAGTSTTQVATTAFVTTAVTASFPSGGIILWSGSIASIPSGWYLCDGNNSTPDLTDRFIIGAGSAYSVDAIGGSKDAIVVSHTHNATTVSTQPAHTHTYDRYTHGGEDTIIGSQVDISADYTTETTSSAQPTITSTTTIESTGSSGTNANLPPYYALAYIMKA